MAEVVLAQEGRLRDGIHTAVVGRAWHSRHVPVGHPPVPRPDVEDPGPGAREDPELILEEQELADRVEQIAAAAREPFELVGPAPEGTVLLKHLQEAWCVPGAEILEVDEVLELRQTTV